MVGNLRNAIPREAFAIVTSDIIHRDEVKKFLSESSVSLQKEFGHTDPEIKLNFKRLQLLK